jgi:hypothetical protein
MLARERITCPAQVLGQILFHLGCRLLGHRVQVLIRLRQQAEDHDTGWERCLELLKKI